jgi:uncharacterized delta-60 repeat protein
MKWLSFRFVLALSLAIGFSSCSKSSPEKKAPEEGDTYRDKSFTPPDGPIWHAVIQPDSQILVAGNIYNTGLKNTVVVARLSKDGVIDQTFNAHKDNWNYSDVNTLNHLKGGKVLIGGQLEVDGKQVPFLCFNADGSLDKSFVMPTGINEPESAATAPDGKIFMVGTYRDRIAHTRRQFLIRLNADGKQDWQMQVGEDFATLSRVIPLIDGKVLVMGEFVNHVGNQSVYIMRLNADLSIDQSFAFNNNFYYNPNPPTGFPKGILSAAVQKDGKIIVTGNFIGYYDINNLNIQHGADGLLRLNPNGTIDESFHSVNASRGNSNDVVVLDDNRILAVRYSTPSQDAEPTIMYTANGARDATFSFTDPHSSIYGITKLSGRNKYLICGSFSTAKMLWRVTF